jgi:esterase/lipase superfamily enzyme
MNTKYASPSTIPFEEPGKDYTLFITNRTLIRDAAADTIPRTIEFNLKSNLASQSIYFCEKRGDQCKEIGSKEFAKRVIVSNRHVLFYIHGFNHQPADVFRKSDELQKLLDTSNVVDMKGKPFFMIPVVWPCKHEINFIDEYWTDEDAADLTAISLARAFLFLFNLRESQIKSASVTEAMELAAQQFNVLAHCMGNRVLVKTLERLKENPLFLNRTIFRNTFLVAANLPNDSLETEKDSAVVEFSKNVCVYYAGDDFALSSSSVIHESHFNLSKRLGQTGPNDNSLLPRNVFSFDCGEFNQEYDSPLGHSYFGEEPETKKAGRVFTHLMMALTGKAVSVNDSKHQEL